MIIKLSPQRREDTLSVVKAGRALTLNGVLFDFTQLSNGDVLPASAIDCPWFIGDVSCNNGEITLCLLLPLPVNYSQEQAFPKDLINVPDGQVQFPQPLPTPEPPTPPEPAPEQTLEEAEQVWADNEAGHFADAQGAAE